jgi:hypothetical protein
VLPRPGRSGLRLMAEGRLDDGTVEGGTGSMCLPYATQCMRTDKTYIFFLSHRSRTQYESTRN